MDTNKVSIIIPVYNTEKYIRKCVESVLNQTYTNIEVILVDDESPDSCPQICDDYSKVDDRIKVVHKKNSGLGYTRNAGLEQVTGDFVTFLDSDDWIDRDHITNLVNPYASDCVDLVIGAYKKCTNKGEIISREIPFVTGKIAGARVNEIAMLMIAPDKGQAKDVGIPMSVCFNLYKVSIIKEHKLNFPSERDTVGEDLFFNLDYLKCCREICGIDSYGYNYRANPTSISRKFTPERIERTLNYYHKLLLLCDTYNDRDEYLYRVQRSTLSKLRVALTLIAGDSCRFVRKYQMTKSVLMNGDIVQILKNYPIKSYRTTIRITTYFMKYKMVLGTLLVFSVKNKYKR